MFDTSCLPGDGDQQPLNFKTKINSKQQLLVEKLSIELGRINYYTMSKLVARKTLWVLILLAVLYIGTLVAANTSVTQRTIQTEVVINASAFKVWRVLMDFEAYPKWNPFIRQVTGAALPGQQLMIELNLVGHTITFRPTILTVKPERELRWIGRLFIPGVFDGEHSFIIEPQGESRVRFVQSETFRRVLVPFTGVILSDTDQGFGEMNQALKERAEQTK